MYTSESVWGKKYYMGKFTVNKHIEVGCKVTSNRWGNTQHIPHHAWVYGMCIRRHTHTHDIIYASSLRHTLSHNQPIRFRGTASFGVKLNQEQLKTREAVHEWVLVYGSVKSGALSTINTAAWA